MKERLDKTDLEIIRLLQNDGRMASSEIAKTISVPEATIRYRLKKLIDKEYIQIVAAANPIKLGFGIVACISIEAEIRQMDHVISQLEKIDRVSYIAQMTSDPSIEIETYIETINELHELLSKIEVIDGVMRVETTFIRRIVRERFDFGTPKYLNGSDNETEPKKN
ncbi:MAG: winged helix-turn-helix transcriptional regulator [Deltaproteobacteria bacterium]|nr:winged helix-turn-helix transcriptional regulator [Deltaproteobacteria bacterium]MBW2677660.1 winged helix-turn-helix transcriptional regulator [Deltaproteobacteria bacterium]